jgi:predicted aspartyl protease
VPLLTPILVLLLGLLASQVLAADEGLPFRLGATGDVVLPVTIDGQGPFRFLLDTGSSRSAISAEIAKRLIARPVGRTRVTTPSGHTTEPVVMLPGVVLGRTAPMTVHAIVVGGDRLGRDMAADGLIGQDVLAGLSYTIDYLRRRFVVHGLAVEPRGTRLMLEVKDGRALVSLPQRSADTGAGCAMASEDCGPLKLVPDSGADGFVLFERPGGPRPAVTPLDAMAMRTLAGTRAVRRVRIDDLDIGSIRLRDQVAAVVTSGGDESSMGDGLLPLHVFARVTFNAREGYLIVEGR